MIKRSREGPVHKKNVLEEVMYHGWTFGRR
jgi:hypothetical protein